MIKFYGFIESTDWNNGLRQEFFTSIEDAVFRGGAESGEIVEYNIDDYEWPNPPSSTPVRVKSYDVSTIENYELFEFLEDRPEMSEENYMVFNRSDEGYENMFTIVSLS
jgi:hypothetical protein